jgi:hypothetical protein
LAVDVTVSLADPEKKGIYFQIPIRAGDHRVGVTHNLLICMPLLMA